MTAAELFPVAVRTTPKNGLTAAQNEDASAAAVVGTTGLFAVADGASEGWQSGAWAHELAAGYAQKPPGPDTFSGWLAERRAHFTAAVPAPAAAPWYAEVKQEQGAFATLCGLTVVPAGDGTGWRWRAVAVGDACLFVVRAGMVRVSFPVESAGGFGNRPNLVPSAVGAKCPEPEWLAGRAEPGDVFYLLTDAVAEWAFAAGAWDALDAALDAADPVAGFAAWVQSERAGKRMKNDDATAVRVRLPAVPPPNGSAAPPPRGAGRRR